MGISVDTATDIAKESADIILLEKNLMVLEEGVIEGRITFGNIIKYIKMTASSNFGNMFSVLVASAFLPFLPMLPLQLLVLDLLYHTSQLSIPFDRMDEEYLRKPRKWDASDIGRFMVWIGPVSSIFDITTYLLLWHVFGANSTVPSVVLSNGLVRRKFADANADRAHDPYTQDSISPERGRGARAGADGRCHPRRHGTALHGPGCEVRHGCAPAGVLRLGGVDGIHLLRADPTDETGLYPPLRALALIPARRYSKNQGGKRHWTLTQATT